MDLTTTSMISKCACPLSLFPPFPPEVLLLAIKMADPSIKVSAYVSVPLIWEYNSYQGLRDQISKLQWRKFIPRDKRTGGC